MKLPKVPLFIALLGLAPGATLAEEIFSNRSLSPNGSYAVASQTWRAVRFTTLDTAAGYFLDEVTLAMAGTATDLSLVSFTLSIYTSVDNRPGQLVEVLSGSTAPVHTDPFHQAYTYTSSGAFLSANTDYWIIAANFGNAAQWSFTVSSPPVSMLVSSNQGASWSVAAPGENMRFSVSATGTEIPEPATYAALAGVTVLGLVCLRRRRMRAGA